MDCLNRLGQNHGVQTDLYTVGKTIGPCMYRGFVFRNQFGIMKCGKRTSCRFPSFIRYHGKRQTHSIPFFVFYSVSRKTVRGIQYRLPLSVVTNKKRNKKNASYSVYTVDSFFVLTSVILNTANDILNRFSLFIQQHGMR
jgi:hypothetical protein